jgi:site-specific recombinase XerD
MCWESGVDVYATAQFVGHSSVTTTLNIYTHLSKEREKQNAQTVRKAFTK